MTSRRDRAAGTTARHRPGEHPSRDRHELYEKAVQCPEADIRFIQRVHRQLNGRPATFLREDFCGTAFLSREWVKAGQRHRAIGVDLDDSTLRWGGVRHRAAPSESGRLQLRRANVLTVRTPRVDVIAALNFSYCALVERSDLACYFRNARRALRPGGILVLDAFGGSEALVEMQETQRKRGFTYVWEQARVDLVGNRLHCYIHFRFPDGSEMRRAFRYDWRLWALPEIRDCLEEQGFPDVRFYFEQTGTNGFGNGRFVRARRAAPCESFITYIVACTPPHSRRGTAARPRRADEKRT